MIPKILDFLLYPISSEEEKAIIRTWLRTILLVTSGLLFLYLIIVFDTTRDLTILFGILGASLVTGLLLYLLAKGHLQVSILLFTVTSIVSLLYCTYAFGGIDGFSYSALAIGIMVASLFLRSMVVDFIAIVCVIFGWLLMQAQQHGLYHPDLQYSNLTNTWIGNALVFLLATLLLGMASASLRKLLHKFDHELQERRDIESELRKQSEFLSALHETTLSIMNGLELVPVLESILTQAEKMAGTPHAYIDVVQPNVKGTIQLLGHGIFASFNGHVIAPGEGATGQALSTGKTVVVEDYAAWDKRLSLGHIQSIHAVVSIPLMIQERVTGIIGMAHTESEKKLTPDIVKTLEQFAELAALTLDHAQIYQAAQDELVERIRAEAALVRSEEKLRLALDAAHMGTWDWDIASDTITWSDNAYKILDIGHNDLDNTFAGHMALVYPSDRIRVERILKESLKHPHESYTLEYSTAGSEQGQEARWIEEKGQLYCDENDRPIRMAGTVTDITERKNAERAIHLANQKLERDKETLEERSKLLKVAAEVSEAASAILDPKLLSQQVVDMVASHFGLYYAGLFLLDGSGQWAVLQAATGPSGHLLLENRHQLEVRSTSMVGWCILHRQARIALDVGEDAVRFNNPLLPKTRSELALPLVSRGQVIGALSIQSQEEAAFSIEDITTFQSMADQLANALLNARLYEQVEQELSERKRVEAEILVLNSQLEERVRERTSELQATNRELEAFSYSVSHDLRTPLRAIDGFSRILMNDFGEQIPTDMREYLQRIVDATQKMSHLIDDLLNLSRVTRSEIHFNDINLTDLAHSIIDELSNREPEREIEIIIAQHLKTRGDERLLHIALENLLNNAWKFTSKSTPARIKIGRKKEKGESVFFVKDNGVGFDMAYADKLFGAFQRLHSIDEFPGTGIGLAIVRRVIEKHGGKVWADAAPGEGATFYFTLP